MSAAASPFTLVAVVYVEYPAPSLVVVTVIDVQKD